LVGFGWFQQAQPTTEATRTLDLFACTLDIFEDDLRKILADEKKGGGR
jgi:hypothetical protein